MKKIFKYLFISFIVVILTTYFSINYFIGKGKVIIFENLFTQKQKNFIKAKIFPYKERDDLYGKVARKEKIISQQEQSLSILKYIDWIDLELKFKKSLKDINTEEIFAPKIGNDLIFKKYKLIDGFYAGRANLFPGTGYIDFHNDNLIVISARGVLGFSENINDDIAFKQIKNNFTDFFNEHHYNKNKWFALKDLHIHKDTIFISYDDEIEPDCWNKSVLWGKINYEEIKFNKLFSSKKCVHSINNIDKEFKAFQSGGRIKNFDSNHILLSVGEYRSRHLAQEKDNINGKIIKININNSEYEIISMGHRNPQGMYFDKENNYILETEHGPMGADEINLIEINKNDNNEIPNYGWAIASAGVHYDDDGVPNKSFEKYPLYKSHKDHGFIEPLKTFPPGIGISEITKIGKNKYVVSSLNGRSIYFFELNKEKKIINLKRVEVFERVRDLFFKDNKLYLFLEDTASIGTILIN